MEPYICTDDDHAALIDPGIMDTWCTDPRFDQ